MPFAASGDVAVRYEVDGDGPAVVFCGEVGLGSWQFGWQHAAVAGRYRAVVPETRGIGESDAPPGPYDVRALAADVDAVLSDLGARDAHLVGYGLGGMVALAYALASGRPESLTVVGTPASGDAFNPDAVWADPDDPGAVRGTLDAVLSAEFRDRHPDVLDRIAEWRVAEDAGPAVFAAHRAAVEGFDLTDRLYEVTTPTLVLHGTEDVVCPPEHGETLAEGLPRGEFETVAGAGHFAHVEDARGVNDELLAWLDEHASD